MKVRALLLGYLSERKPFYVYQLPGTEYLLYRLSNISLLFNIPQLHQHPSLTPAQLSRTPHCYQDSEDYFVNTKVIADAAVSLNKYMLAEFCKLKPNDYTAGLADSILNAVPLTERARASDWIPVDLALTQISIEQQPVSHASMTETGSSDSNKPGNDRNAATDEKSPALHPVKQEPLSPSYMPASPGPSDQERDSTSRAGTGQGTGDSAGKAGLDAEANGLRRRSG